MIVGDRYRLVRELGSGGAATVWLADDFVGERQVAVKILHATDDGTHARSERLKREARLLSTLGAPGRAGGTGHPNVVRVHDVGEHQGRAFIVMEVLDGGSLADRVQKEGPMRPADAVRAMLPVLDVLARSHDLGIVHRDVKPGNLLLRATGEVVLCDFGIARVEASDQDTRTGVALGSMGYMAPEQRIDARRVGPAADVYAAACTLFNLVTGDTPVDLYLAPDHSPRWEAVPAALRPVLRRATRSEPSARHHTAVELAQDLEALLPALLALPAARTRLLETPIGHPPTRVDPEPSLKAEQRERFVDREEWAWAEARRPTGRSALWVGLTVAGVAVLSSVVFGQLAERLAVERQVAPVVAPVAVPTIAGGWFGTVDAHRAELTFDGTRGHAVVHVGPNELRWGLVGGWQERESAFVLTDDDPGGAGVWVLRPSASHRVIEGELRRQRAEPLPVAFVRDTPEADLR